MKHLRIRIWCVATITLLLAAGIVRLVWHFVSLGSVLPTDGWALGILLIIAAIGAYGLFLYLLVRPNRTRSLVFRIWFTVIATSAFAGATIHFARYVPSPEASSPISLVLAILLLVAVVSAYLLALNLVWSAWKG